MKETTQANATAQTARGCRNGEGAGAWDWVRDGVDMVLIS
jgi:hypothetical protein